MVGQQRYRRTGAEEGLAVGGAYRVLCRPFGEECVQGAGDAAAQLVEAPHQVGVGRRPQSLRHHGGGVFEAEARQGDRVCRPVVGEAVHGLAGEAGAGGWGLGRAGRCGVSGRREQQSDAGRDPVEVDLVEQSEGFGVGVVGVVDEYDRGRRPGQSGGECFGHRRPVVVLHRGERLRGRACVSACASSRRTGGPPGP
ncbi:hypothetical protein ACRJ4B_23040 [Streptomyces sp. GTA36]